MNVQNHSRLVQNLANEKQMQESISYMDHSSRWLDWWGYCAGLVGLIGAGCIITRIFLWA